MYKPVLRTRLLMAVVTAVLLVATPLDSRTHVAHAAGSLDVPADLKPRAQAICKRVPLLLARVDEMLIRLPSGPSTKGSIAAVKAKAQAARDRNRKALADAFDERAESLTKRLAQLPNQKAVLQKAGQTCSTYGYQS